MNEDDLVMEDDGVPTRLETPVTTTPVVLPTVTRLAVLPLHTLQWEDFERLCLRYARGQGTVVRSQLYGIKGQEQYGIDLYVRSSDPPHYEVYQCKKIENFSATTISKAVDKFLKGTWHNRTKAFRIMTSHPIEDAKIAEAIEAAAEILEARQITFEVLGETQISDWLKGKPRIVDEFFSRPWIEPFCGPDALKELGHRLSADDVAKYRKELKRFYETLFGRHDPGIPVAVQLGEHEISFRERFTAPDVFASTRNEFINRSATKVERNSMPENDTGSSERRSTPSASASLPDIRIRSGIDRWLSQAQRSVLLGGPGSGKSVLLRVLAIELLSEEPLFKETATRWGHLLPIWIPFSFWTSLNADRSSPVAFSECLTIWFKQFDQTEVWKLVEAALNDDRLLLLVDSLDEWTDETAARTTSDLLHTYVQLHNFPAVLVSRPHGFDRVALQGADWQRGELAPLSAVQQKELVVKWLTIHLRRKVDRVIEGQPAQTFEEEAGKDAEDFIDKLARSKDLAQLAEVPLTLLLLLLLHLQNSPLPANRFEAYEHVTQHFIREHPLARRAAATRTADQDILSPLDIKNALAYVAYFVQTNFPAGMILTDDIREHLATFLQDEAGLGLGLSRVEARDVLRSFTNIEEGSLGLLVSQGQSHVSFFHRSLQEYLASVHLSRMSLGEQQTVVTSQIGDSRWREVILGAIFLCRRSEDADALTQALEQLDIDPLGRLKRDDILAEIAFKDTNLSQGLAKRLTAKTFQTIESSSVESHRSRLVTHTLSGLRTRKSKTLVRDRIKRWTFSRGLWGPGRIGGLRSWPATEHTWEVLFRVLHDEDASVMREAGGIMAHLFSKSTERGDVIAKVAMGSDNPNQRAAAIESLAKGWPDHPVLPELISNGRESISNEIRIASLSATVRLGQQQDRDLQALLSLSWDRYGPSVEYGWRPEVADALVAGFSKNATLKQECMKAGGHQARQPGLMDGGLALFVSIKAFPQDDEVAARIALQLKQDHPFVSSDSIWQLLPANFKDHPTVIPALDEWIATKETPDVIALHYGSLVGRTPQMKAKLFGALDKWVPFWAAGALLDGWGMTDPETAEKLLGRAQQNDAAEIAHYIPRIYNDSNKALARLMELLRDGKPHRTGTIIQGLSELQSIDSQSEIVTVALQRIDSRTPWRDEHAISSLIAGFPTDARVKQLARESLQTTNPPFDTIEEAFANDEEIRTEVGELITPLPVGLRYQIVSDLPVFSDTLTAKEILKYWDVERNGEVKTQASVQFHSLISLTDPERSAIVEGLASSLPCYGPDHEVRRQAIGAALTILQQLHRVVGKLETTGLNGKQINIPVTDGSRQNRVFLNLLGKHWVYIKEALQNDLTILESHIGSNDLWERVAVVAADYPKLARDVFRQAETDAELRGSANYLKLLGRLEPGSENLVNACFAAIADRSQRHDWFDSVETSATILSEQFRGNAKIEERLGAMQSPYHIPTSVLMALSLGWPNTEVLQSFVFDDRRRSMEAGELYPKYTKIPPSQVSAALEADLLLAQDNPYLANNLIRPLSARLQNDAEVAESLMRTLSVSTDPSVKSSFPKLLAFSRGISSELDKWCREELARQEARSIPEIGYDLLAKSTRSVRLCLLETLEGAPLSGGVAEGLGD